MRVEGFYIKPSAANPRAVRAYEKAEFIKTVLSFEEAQKEYGPADDFDSVYMTRNIETGPEDG